MKDKRKNTPILVGSSLNSNKESLDSLLETTIRIEPQPSRYLRTKYGIAPTADHKNYIKRLRWWLTNYKDWIPDKETPLCLVVTYYIQKPKASKRQYPTVPPDLDNLSKPMLDALKPLKVRRILKESGVIADDAQIIYSLAIKLYTKHQPKIKIRLWAIPNNQKSSDLPIQDMLNLMPPILT